MWAFVDNEEMYIGVMTELCCLRSLKGWNVLECGSCICALEDLKCQYCGSSSSKLCKSCNNEHADIRLGCFIPRA